MVIMMTEMNPRLAFLPPYEVTIRSGVLFSESHPLPSVVSIRRALKLFRFG